MCASRKKFQSRPLEPNIDLFGPGVWLWTAAARTHFITPAGPFSGSEAGFSAAVATGLGLSTKWTATTNAGVSFSSNHQPIPHSSGHTVVVVAAPVAAAAIKYAFGQIQGTPTKQNALAGFNLSAIGGAASGRISLNAYDGTAIQAVTATSGGIDGKVHCWVLANDANQGYIYKDGLPLTLTTDQRLTANNWGASSLSAIGNNSFTTSTVAMTDPLLLVAVIPRVISPARAAYISRVLSKSLAPAFKNRVVFSAAVAAGGFVATATDALSLADSAVSLTERLTAANDTLAITDSAVSVTERISEAIDALALADTATASISTPVSASDTLTLADSALALTNISADGQDALSLSDGAESLASRTADAVDAIALSEAATSIVDLSVVATDALILADSAQSLVGGASAASDTIAPADSAGALVSMVASASDGVSLADVALAVSERLAGAIDSVGLTDSAAALIAGPGVTAAVASDAVAFSDEASAIGPRPPEPGLPIAAKLLGPAPRKQRNVKFKPVSRSVSHASECDDDRRKCEDDTRPTVASPQPIDSTPTRTEPQQIDSPPWASETAPPPPEISAELPIATPAPSDDVLRDVTRALDPEALARETVRGVLSALAKLPPPVEDEPPEPEAAYAPAPQPEPPAPTVASEPLPTPEPPPPDPEVLYDNNRRRAILVALLIATSED